MTHPKRERQQRPRWVSEHLPAEIVESEIFRFNVRLPNGMQLTVDLFNDIDIEYEILEEQLENGPAQYSYWGAVYSELKMNVTMLERKIKVRKGVVSDRVVKEAAANKVRLTDKQIAAIVEADDDLNRLEVQLALAEKNAGKVFHMLKALEMRSEHMRSLTGFKRHDYTQSSGAGNRRASG